MTPLHLARIPRCASPSRPSSSVANSRQALPRAGFFPLSVAGSGNARIGQSGSAPGRTADTRSRRYE